MLERNIAEYHEARNDLELSLRAVKGVGRTLLGLSEGAGDRPMSAASRTPSCLTSARRRRKRWSCLHLAARHQKCL
jgi:hypothetical protein